MSTDASETAPNWNHAKANVAEGVDIHYVRVKPSKPNGVSIVLIHGYPQTWYAWRHVMEPLADLGYDVIVPDYRGAGASSRPVTGYDKITMATDIHTLYHDVLGIGQAVIVGHDVGSMVALALAIKFGQDLLALVICEAPHPGTDAYTKAVSETQFSYPAFFHFFFHNAPDLPEMLTAGKERLYIKHFFDRLCFNPAFYINTDLDTSDANAASFESAGAMRAGFETYRAFEVDHGILTSLIREKGQSSFPVLATGGEHSLITQWIGESAAKISDDVTEEHVPASGHWIAEEHPSAFIEILARFLSVKLGRDL